MRDRNFRGNRRSWQPWFDLHPPTYENLVAVIAAIETVLIPAGFDRGPFGFEPISDDAPLHMRASWARAPLTDRHDHYLADGDGVVGSVDTASVWGSGLIRIDVDNQAIELTFRDALPETLAAIVAAHVDAADAPYL